ncbi:MAG: CvpA family protein [Moraxellaceae bacterium]|nr:CvpA family protein [Moraxellaceae bacterium]MBS9779162.1 CvpA family protein [Moraxellaceae bacterium]
MNELNMLDFMLMGFTIFGMIKGFKVGFIQSVVSFVGWFIALIVGSHLAPIFAPKFVEIVDSSILQSALGFLTAVLGILALLQVVVWLMKKMLVTLKLGFLDKFAGGILGGLKHILIILVVLNFMFPIFSKLPFWQTSKLAPELLPYAPLADKLIDTTKTSMGNSLQTLNKNIDDNIKENSDKKEVK